MPEEPLAVRADHLPVGADQGGIDREARDEAPSERSRTVISTCRFPALGRSVDGTSPPTGSCIGDEPLRSISEREQGWPAQPVDLDAACQL